MRSEWTDCTKTDAVAVLVCVVKREMSMNAQLLISQIWNTNMRLCAYVDEVPYICSLSCDHQMAIAATAEVYGKWHIQCFVAGMEAPETFITRGQSR